MPTTPDPITALTGITPPSRTDPANFSSRGDATLGALPSLITQMDAAAQATYENAIEATAAAVIAAGTNDAPIWVSGTTYAIGDCRWSPVTRFVYRRITAGAGTTDPSLDTTNWVLANAATPTLFTVSTATQTAIPFVHYVITYAGVCTLTLPAAPAVGDWVTVTVANSRIDNVLARNGNVLQGSSTDMTLNVNSWSRTLRYLGATLGWRIV